MKSNLQHPLKLKTHVHFDKAILILQVLLQNTYGQNIMCTRTYSFKELFVKENVRYKQNTNNRSQVNYDSPYIQML